VVAASLAAHRSLVEQLQNKTVRREYYAIARGCLTGGGTIDAPIGRHPQQRTRMAVRERGGREAVTHYRLLERYAHFTALAVRLETGRTHQIRVHLAHRGYPLLGDPVYGGRLRLPRGATQTLLDALDQFRRQALHARRLAFKHPVTGELQEFESPIPADLGALREVLATDDPWGSSRQ
jgi:23S rRNA pseudouridine1911/1915/1917 synthase